MYISVGERFCELTTQEAAYTSTDLLTCLCDCGRVVVKEAFRLKAGTAKRCVGRNHNFSQTHRMMYNSWRSMINRCHDPRHPSYSNYGERGVYVCDEWRRSFLNFLADMSERPEGMELDRIDNDGPYSPENCRWVTRSENNRNKRTNRLLTIFGETKTIQGWVEDSRTAVTNKKTLEKRLRLCWNDYDAVMKEVRRF